MCCFLFLFHLYWTYFFQLCRHFAQYAIPGFCRLEVGLHWNTHSRFAHNQSLTIKWATQLYFISQVNSPDCCTWLIKSNWIASVIINAWLWANWTLWISVQSNFRSANPKTVYYTTGSILKTHEFYSGHFWNFLNFWKIRKWDNNWGRDYYSVK